VVEKLEVLVDGGKATPGPPLGPRWASRREHRRNPQGDQRENEVLRGDESPVTLLVDPKTKTSRRGRDSSDVCPRHQGAQVEKGSGTGQDRVGNLSLAQAIKIANMKADAMLAKSSKLASSRSSARACRWRHRRREAAKEFTKEIKAGKYDKQLAAEGPVPVSKPVPVPSCLAGRREFDSVGPGEALPGSRLGKVEEHRLELNPHKVHVADPEALEFVATSSPSR